MAPAAPSIGPVRSAGRRPRPAGRGTSPVGGVAAVVILAGLVLGAAVARAAGADLGWIGIGSRAPGGASSAGPSSVASGGVPGPASTRAAGLASADRSAVAAAPATPLPTAVGIDLAARSTSDPASLWVVVNKRHPLVPLEYAPTGLVWLAGGMVRGEVVPDLRSMIAAAQTDGVPLSLRNAYRSYRDQLVIHADVVKGAGAGYADRYSARPGYSEHQTGLALDLHSASQPACDLAPCFAQTVEAVWAAAHAWEFGFVVRYTPENATVTGYGPEAWHLRYVGRDLAGWMHVNRVTSLEEAFGVAGGAEYATG